MIGFAGLQANVYVYVGNDPVNGVDPSGLYNLIKGGVGATNAVRGVMRIATGAGTIVAGTATLPIIGLNVVGAAAIGVGVVQVGLGLGNVGRGTQQLGEAMNEEFNDAHWRNILGLAPFGQRYDDPWEPGPVEYFEDAAKRFDAFAWLNDFFALGPYRKTTNSGTHE